MYGWHRIIIGQFLLQLVPDNKQLVAIENSDGEAGEFNLEAFEAHIREFFEREF